MKNIMYLIYFFKSTDYTELKYYINKSREKKGAQKFRLIIDMLFSSLIYKSNFTDYFLFDFQNMSQVERRSYLTTGDLYEFHKKMNDRNHISSFRSKSEFNKLFKKFINREYLELKNVSRQQFTEWLKNKKSIIVKPYDGATGAGIEIIEVVNEDKHDLIYDYLHSKNIEIVEEVIEQHESLNQINPSSVNTLRIITVNHSGEVEIIAAILRIGVDNHVDNFSAGGIAAPVNFLNGRIEGNAISKRTLTFHEHHPTTNFRFKGFIIPYWPLVLEMVYEAAKVVPEVKTVEWDIAITENGPELIEGNDNWGKDTFQLPYKQGRKNLLEKYL